MEKSLARREYKGASIEVALGLSLEAFASPKQRPSYYPVDFLTTRTFLKVYKRGIWFFRSRRRARKEQCYHLTTLHLSLYKT